MEFLVPEYETTVLTYQIEMDNVELDTNCSDYVLFRDVKEKEVKGVLYLPVVMDCNGTIIDTIDNNACSMTVRKTAPGIFSVDIVLKKNFIETACYPLKVNGSIHLYKPKQPDSAIYSLLLLSAFPAYAASEEPLTSPLSAQDADHDSWPASGFSEVCCKTFPFAANPFSRREYSNYQRAGWSRRITLCLPYLGQPPKKSG